MTMIIVAYGAGTNSTAMLIGMKNLGIIPDLITFADTGGETPATYKHLEIMQRWCEASGFPEIHIVRGQQPQQLADGTLEQECLRLEVLPSRVYGMGSCSMKWKRDPQDRFIRGLPEVQELWKSGEKPVKFIGYDADEERRASRAAFQEDKKFDYQFPLIEWDWAREECIEAIEGEGLALPGKSSCFFCPSMKQHEIRALAVTYPDLMKRAVEMEQNAAEKMTTIKGLGRSFAWSDVIATDDMFPESFIEEACGCYDG